MNKESQPRLKDGSVDVKSYLIKGGRRLIDLGENFDGSHTKLEPYVEIDKVQIHPDRLERYLNKLKGETNE